MSSRCLSVPHYLLPIGNKQILKNKILLQSLTHNLLCRSFCSTVNKARNEIFNKESRWTRSTLCSPARDFRSVSRSGGVLDSVLSSPRQHSTCQHQYNACSHHNYQPSLYCHALNNATNLRKLHTSLNSQLSHTYCNVHNPRILQNNPLPKYDHSCSQCNIHTTAHHNAIYVIHNEADFETKVMHSSLPVVVNFHADWCEPCHALKPLLEELAKKFEGRFHLAEVKVDDHVALLQAFEVTAVPAVLAVVKGQVTEKFVGLISEAEVRAFIVAMIGE